MQLKKIIRNTLIVVPLFVLAYLGIAATWAWSSVDQLVAAYPAANGSTLTPRQTGILIKIEDPTFFEHAGLSLADGQGITTISSSMARDVFLMHGDLDGAKGAFQDVYRAVFNCCKKIDIGRDVMALVLNAKVPKDRQLALYATQIYMGSHHGAQIKGLEQASAAYAGKPLSEASDKEFTALVAMIKAPNQFHPLKNRPAHALRVSRVEAIVSGACKPDGWFDTEYEHCKLQ